MLYFHLPYFLFLLSAVNGACQLLINEVNADNPKNVERLEFVELKGVNCPDNTIDLSGYRLIFLKGFGTSKSPEIDGHVTFPKGNHRLKKGFYVIGDKAVTPTPDITLDNPKAVLRQKYYAGSMLLHFAISNGNVVPHGVLLLKVPAERAF